MDEPRDPSAPFTSPDAGMRTGVVLLALSVMATAWGCERDVPPGSTAEAPSATFQSAEVDPPADSNTGVEAGSRADGSESAAAGDGLAGETLTTPVDSALIAYLANEGVMIVAAGRTVLIDALFREGVRGYTTVDDRMLEAMELGVGAFGGVDLVLASHHHADHFDPASVLRHLRSNEIARFVSTAEALSDLEDAVAGSAPEGETGESVLGRATGVTLEEGQDTLLSFDDVQLRVLDLHHGQRPEPIQNLGLLLDIGGFKILHVGDTEASLEEFAVYGLEHEGIHVVLLPYWKLLEADGPRLVREIGANRVVAIHLPAPNAPTSWFGPAGSRLGLVSELDRAVPGVIVFDEPGETHQLGYWPVSEQ
jgi:L-ascorbate metabolism protein UlaG (beta-lactamase superfamily)